METPSRVATESQALRHAIMFLTRLPVRVDYLPNSLAVSARYFPLVGLGVGGFCAALLVCLSTILPREVALLISIAGGILITGALHEDGLADCADAFGSGAQGERLLSIMKDSRLGTFGVSALVIALAIKFTALGALSVTDAAMAMITAHSLSRAVAISYLYDLTYVQDPSQSKVQPNDATLSERTLTILVASSGLLLIVAWGISGLILGALLMVLRQLWARYLTKKLGGYTGDCLGAAQQLSEVGCYVWFCSYI